MDLIRARLCNDELKLLYYNLFTLQGINFIEYVVKFKLLDDSGVNKVQKNTVELYKIVINNHDLIEIKMNSYS